MSDPATAVSAATGTLPVVDVVCGVVWSRDGRYLLAQRPEGRIWSGYWEFPGGKIEPAESPLDAIVRELHEELGIAVTRADPWLLKVFEYPHAVVRLHFFHVRGWSGTPQCLEGQTLHWQVPTDLRSVEPLLPANAPLMRLLGMPGLLPVTPATDVPHRDALARVEAGLARAPKAGHACSWLQVRRGALEVSDWRDWVELCKRHSVTPIANTSVEEGLALGVGALHVNAQRLAELESRPPLPLVGASVHSRAEMERAASLGLDYVILGSVKKTPSHPDHHGLGWQTWAEIARWAPLPVYAIGGLTPTDLDDARSHGAAGIAMIGAAWSPA